MRQVTAVVDFGTSHTVVVVSGPDLPPQLVSLEGAPWFPSAVFWRRDGRAILGAEAEQLAREEPARLERHPKARIGEPEVLLGDSVVPTTTLVRAVLATVLAEAIRVAGATVQHLVLTHPADWGSTKLGALMTAAQGLVPRLSTVPEPVGAAAWFATRHELPIGAALAVLDFGGGTCDAAVVRRERTGLSIVDCAGLPDLGGEDLDQRIVEYLRRGRPVLGELLDQAERARPVAAAELPEIARLRADVRRAKEELSHHQQVEVPLPGGLPEVLLTRAELESAIEPDLRRAVELVDRAIRTSGLAGTELAAVHLVGGSSRIPLLAQLLRARLAVPVLLDQQPEIVVALGTHEVVQAPGGADTDTAPTSVTAQPPGPAPIAAPAEERRRGSLPVVVTAVLVVLGLVAAAMIDYGLFDRTVDGAPAAPPNAVIKLNLPPPAPGKKVENPGHPTARLPEVRQGEQVTIRHFPDRPDTLWRLDSFADNGETNQQLVRLGNPNTPGYRWILVRATETLTGAVQNYQPVRTYLVDDQGLMIDRYEGQAKLPQDCPENLPSGNLPGGTEVRMCLAYQIPAATPVVEVAAAALSHEHPTNLFVPQSIPNGGRVTVGGANPSRDPAPLPDDALEAGVPAFVAANSVAADLSVVDVIEDISGYFDVQYANDEVLGVPGSKGVLVRIAVRLREATDGTRMPVLEAWVEDERGAAIKSPFSSYRNECTPRPFPARVEGTVVYCAFAALPADAAPRAVRVKFTIGADVRVWRVP